MSTALALVGSVATLVVVLVAGAWRLSTALGAIRLELREIQADLRRHVQSELRCHEDRCPARETIGVSAVPRPAVPIV